MTTNPETKQPEQQKTMLDRYISQAPNVRWVYVRSETAPIQQGVYFLRCPHCNGEIMVNEGEIACKIFRHGSFKVNGQQIPSHAPKDQCDYFVQHNLVWGCAKPFYFDGQKLEICGYI
jgi:hypothetical protein